MKIVEQQSLLSFRYYFCHFNLMTLALCLLFLLQLLSFSLVFEYGFVNNSAPFLPYKHKSKSVNEDVGEKRKSCRDDHIRKRMLLEEHRGQNDEKAEDCHKDLAHLRAHQFRICPPHSDHHCQRIVNVNARAHIRGSIDHV